MSNRVPLALRRASLLGGASVTAIALVASGGLAHAQEAGAEPTVVEDVVVTGSRIARTTFTTPTPVTVVGAEQLIESKPLISEALNELPQIAVGSQRTGGAGSGGQGFATVSLRNLGINRTLVLLDGRRFVPTAGNSAVDTSLMPNNLVSRVEIVTGGASAAYGADAVAGVVNYILNTKFEGQKFNAEYGLSQRGDVPEGQFAYAFGRSLFGGRGHMLFNVEAYRSDGIRQIDRDFFTEGRENLLPNPCPAGTAVSANCPADRIGGPARFRATNVHLVSGNPGGIITAGPLKGITFEDNGATRMFQYGTYVGTRLQLGGEGDTSPGGDGGPLTTAVGWLQRANVFNRFSYDLTDSIQVFFENTLAWNNNENVAGYPYALGATQFTIRRDNAFLPASVRDRMVALNLQTISVGKQLTQWPRYTTRTRVLTWRPLVGAHFDIGEKWNVEAYYQHGYNRRALELPGNLDQIRVFDGVDAVVVPATGAPPGFIPGQIVCRSTLTNPTNGCVPTNIFGPNSASAAAIANSTTTPTRTTWNLTHYEQDVVSVAASGEVFEGWAGPISAAFGAEARWEKLDFTSDAYSQISNPITRSFGGYRAGNALPFAGKLDVKEAFAEVIVPLAKDMPFAYSAEVNAAGRVTDYSTSGTVYTWKVGALWNPIEDLRFRITRSRDIRAPTMQNLFQAGNAGNGNFRDPFRNGIETAGVRTVTLGNPTLAPEIAQTLVYGVVYRPSWFQGLSMSVDRWDIDIKDSIASIANQTILDQCFANRDSAVCAFIVRDANGVLTAINNRPFNFAFAKTDGVDVELSLSKPIASWMPVIGDGNYNFRVVATRVFHNNTQTPGEAVNEGAGEEGSPKLLALAQMTVTKGPWRGFLQASYKDKIVYDRAYVEGRDIDDNDIGDITYWSARISREITVMDNPATVSFAIDNLFDREPPTGLAGGDYDVVGRYFRLSFASKF